jgi:hypothetical protein
MSLTAALFVVLGLLSLGLVIDLVLTTRTRGRLHGDAATSDVLGPKDSTRAEEMGRRPVDEAPRELDEPHPSEPLRVFISSPMTSLSQAELTLVRDMTGRLKSDLQRQGFEVVTPLETLRAGEDFEGVILQQLARADALLVLTGENTSVGVGVEIGYANRSLIPVAMLRQESAPPSLTSLASLDVLSFRTADEVSARATQWLAALSTELRAKRDLRTRALRDIEPLRLSLLDELTRQSSALVEEVMSPSRLARVLAEPATFAGARLSEIAALSRLVGTDASNYLEHHTSADSGGKITESEWSALMAAAVVADWSPLEITALVERRVSGQAVDATRAARTPLMSSRDWQRFFEQHINERSG